jgi:hypothetical protein
MSERKRSSKFSRRIFRNCSKCIIKMNKLYSPPPPPLKNQKWKQNLRMGREQKFLIFMLDRVVIQISSLSRES